MTVTYLSKTINILWKYGKGWMITTIFIRLLLAFTPMQGTQQLLNQTSTVLASIYTQSLYLADFFDFLEYEDSSVFPAGGTSLFPDRLRNGITFTDVSFHYPHTNKEVLQNISIHIKAGERVAIEDFSKKHSPKVCT